MKRFVLFVFFLFFFLFCLYCPELKPTASLTPERFPRVSQCRLPDPENISGVLINMPKHLSNLKFTVLQKMQKSVEYSEYRRTQ